MTALAAHLGRILRTARTTGDRSLRDTATAAGVAAPTLSDLEAGRDNPTLARVEQTAADYGIALALVDLSRLAAAADHLEQTARQAATGNTYADAKATAAGVRLALDLITHPEKDPTP